MSRRGIRDLRREPAVETFRRLGSIRGVPIIWRVDYLVTVVVGDLVGISRLTRRQRVVGSHIGVDSSKPPDQDWDGVGFAIPDDAIASAVN